MAEISYRRHRFPPVIIQHAVWLYLRFTLSYRDVEELLAEYRSMGLEMEVHLDNNVSLNKPVFVLP
jgi:transposase-like protein